MTKMKIRTFGNHLDRTIHLKLEEQDIIHIQLELNRNEIICSINYNDKKYILFNLDNENTSLYYLLVNVKNSLFNFDLFSNEEDKHIDNVIKGVKEILSKVETPLKYIMLNDLRKHQINDIMYKNEEVFVIMHENERSLFLSFKNEEHSKCVKTFNVTSILKDKYKKDVFFNIIKYLYLNFEEMELSDIIDKKNYEYLEELTLSVI